MKMCRKINALLRGIGYRIRSIMDFEVALRGLTSHRWYCLEQRLEGDLLWENPWIVYLTEHSEIRYLDAIGLYNILITLPVKITRRRAKRITKLVLDLDSLSYSVSKIEAYLKWVYKEDEKNNGIHIR